MGPAWGRSARDFVQPEVGRAGVLVFLQNVAYSTRKCWGGGRCHGLVWKPPSLIALETLAIAHSHTLMYPWNTSRARDRMVKQDALGTVSSLLTDLASRKSERLASLWTNVGLICVAASCAHSKSLPMQTYRGLLPAGNMAPKSCVRVTGNVGNRCSLGRHDVLDTPGKINGTRRPQHVSLGLTVLARTVEYLDRRLASYSYTSTNPATDY